MHGLASIQIPARLLESLLDPGTWVAALVVGSLVGPAISRARVLLLPVIRFVFFEELFYCAVTVMNMERRTKRVIPLGLSRRIFVESFFRGGFKSLKSSALTREMRADFAFFWSRSVRVA